MSVSTSSISRLCFSNALFFGGKKRAQMPKKFCFLDYIIFVLWCSCHKWLLSFKNIHSKDDFPFWMDSWVRDRGRILSAGALVCWRLSQCRPPLSGLCLQDCFSQDRSFLAPRPREELCERPVQRGWRSQQAAQLWAWRAALLQDAELNLDGLCILLVPSVSLSMEMGGSADGGGLGKGGLCSSECCGDGSTSVWGDYIWNIENKCYNVTILACF